MPDRALDQTVYVARPHRVRVITISATLALCLLTAIGWFLLPEEIRALFTLSQRLTLLGVLALLIVGMVALASSYVRADLDGLRIRNGLRVHAVPWGRVHKIILRPGDPWALLLVTTRGWSALRGRLRCRETPADGHSGGGWPTCKGCGERASRTPPPLPETH